MPDLSPPRAAHELDLADRERREVVVQQEALLALPLERLDHLNVFGGSEGAGHQRLRLAAGKKRGAVRSGQQADLTGHRADLVERAPVEALALDEDRPAELLLDHVVQDGPHPRTMLGPLPLGEGGDGVLFDLVDGLALSELAADAERLVQGRRKLLPDRSRKFLGPPRRRRDPRRLGFADLLHQAPLGGDDLLDLSVGDVDGIEDLRLGYPAGSERFLVTWSTSTIVMPSAVPATTISSWEAALCSWVGLATSRPSTSATRAAPTGLSNGQPEIIRAAEAPLMASTSGSLAPSADSTLPTICVSWV